MSVSGTRTYVRMYTSMYVRTGAYLTLRAIVREIEMAAKELDKNGIDVGAIFTFFEELQK